MRVLFGHFSKRSAPGEVVTAAVTELEGGAGAKSIERSTALSRERSTIPRILVGCACLVLGSVPAAKPSVGS